MYRIIYSDIDGTVADASHRQHLVSGKSKNWMGFYEGMVNDAPHTDIIWLLQTLWRAGCGIVCGTGRPEEYRPLTEDWLDRYEVPFCALYMRATGDYRSDDIVKVELLNRMRADGYDPFMAFDDRQRVVDALRNTGLRVLQVQPGDF